MRSDLSLINAARFGDGAAFGQLVDRYANLLLRFALRFVSSPDAAEELAQDTLVSFYRNLDRYEPRAALGTYLCAILKKKALSAKRKEKRNAVALHTEEIEDCSVSPLGSIAQHEELMRLKKQVDSLKEPLRIVVELRYMDGMKLREVAEALDIPLGTVKSRISTALAMLRKGLEKGENR